MMSTLDLHGIRHSDATLKIENFIYLNQDSFPLSIVCGNSHRMIDIARAVIENIGCEYSMYKYGTITIHRFK